MNIATIIEQNELQFDRYLGQTLTLPHSGFDNIRIHPNDTAIASVINLSFKKLYENFLYLYKSSRVASNIIPVSQIAIAGVSASPRCIVEGLTIKIAYSDTEGPCPGGHVCDAATYDFYMNGVYLGEVNLNNGLDGGDRESTFVLTKSQAEAIAAVSPIVTFGIFCNVPPNVDLGWGLGQCHANLPWIRVYTPDGAILYEECAAEVEFQVNLCEDLVVADDNMRWHMYSEGLSSSQFYSLENADLYGQDNISAMIVSENILEKSFNIFTSSGPDLVIYNNSSTFLTVPIDAITTITTILSTQDIYPDAGVKWKKITDFAFTDDYSLFVVDMSGNRVVKYDATGFFTDNNILKNKLVYEDSIGGFGSINDNNLFNQPYSVDVYGDYVYVLDSGNYSVKKFDKNLNWISTYRQVRDFLSAFPVHLSHDSDGNMYVLTQKNLIYKYDNNFQNKLIIPLDSLSANNETYLKLEFSPSDKNIFYVISDKNIYKKLITTPDEDVGKYLPYIFRTDTEETYTAFSSLKGDDGDFNYVFSKSPNGAGKITIWYDNINLFDVLSVNNFDIYTFDEIKINNEEYLQNWVFNKAIAKLLLNHMRFRDQITGRFIAKRDSKNNITFRGTRYFLPNELERLAFDQDMTNYIGMNEIFQNNIVNRCLERIYNIQVLLYEALTAEIQSGFDSVDIVFLD